LNQSLLSAAQALVNGADEAVAEATSTASAQLSRLAAAARAGEAGRQPPADAEQPTTVASPTPEGDQDAPATGDPAAVQTPASEALSDQAGSEAEPTGTPTVAEPGAVGELPALGELPELVGPTGQPEGAEQAPTGTAGPADQPLDAE